MLKMIHHPLYSMNNFVTNKSKLPHDGGTSVSLYGVIGYHVTLSEGHMIANLPIYGVIDYYVPLAEGHMMANQPIWEHNYSYHIRVDRSALNDNEWPSLTI